MSGYPRGTMCVVVWMKHRADAVGSIIEARDKFMRSADPMSIYPMGEPLQWFALDEGRGASRPEGWVPIAWVRPLSDPDAITKDEKQEVTA